MVPAIPPELVLKVEGLRTIFDLRGGQLAAVDDVSCEIERGKTLCVVGESGSGKSVMARSILQIVDRPGRIAAGRILLNRRRPDGVETVDLARFHPRSPEIRAIRGKEIAMIFQEPMSSLSPVHTIGQQIVEAIRLHLHLGLAEARDRAAAMLEQVRIPNPRQALDSFPFEFSGGMRQRAMIAMALSCEPSLLIADEPTTALDVTTQAEILELIAELQSRLGMAVLFITHDMGVVAEIADKVMVMYHGRVQETGEVDQIFHAPQAPYTQGLLASVLRLESRAKKKDAQEKPKSETAPPVLEVRNLTMHFPIKRGFLQRTVDHVRAVTDVSLTLHEGETLGIVGESGSGKTTLGRCLMRIYDPNAGTMLYRDGAGREIDLMGLDKPGLRAVRRDIRMIFQDPYSSLNPRMTVFQLVAEPMLVNHTVPKSQLRDRVAELLRRVGLPPEHMSRYPHAFSGGQRQRIGIARALALEPRIVVADEATSALDVSLRAQVLDLMLDLQEEFKLSYIFVSHDISVVRYICDRVAVMYKGEIVEIDTADKVCGDPQHPYTKMLLSAVPKPDPRQRGIRRRLRRPAA